MKNYIICSSTKKNYDIVHNLNQKNIGNFYLITNINQLTKDFIEFLNPEYIFFPHWSYIISSQIYENFNCVIFHMTDLPYGRGGSPLQNLIIRNHKETKISAIKCSEVLDGGDVYLKKDLSLHGCAEDILLRAKDVIEEMIIEIINKNPVPYKQEGNIVKFKRRSPDQSEIKDIKDLNSLYDFIRMLDGENYPKAFINYNDFKIEFENASIKDHKLIANIIITQNE